MKLLVVGCSGSGPSPDSPASCYVVQAPDEAGRTWSVVLDLGNGAFGVLQRYLDPTEIDAIVISHLHLDHLADLGAVVVHAQWGGDLNHPLAVFGPNQTLQRLAQLEGENPDASYTGLLEFTPITPRNPWQIGPIQVEAFAAFHTQEAYCFRLTELATGQVITYTGDTDQVPDLSDAAQGADLLVTEVGFSSNPDQVAGVHMTGKQAACLASQAGAKQVLITHVQPWADRQRITRDIQENYRAPWQYATPGLVIELG